MEMTQERELPFAPEVIWHALKDPQALRICIPGCERFDAEAPDHYQAVVSMGIGRIRARFRGHVAIEEAQYPHLYRLGFAAQGRLTGSAQGRAHIQLAGLHSGDTLLGYRIEVDLGGRLARFGTRVVDAAAGRIAGEFVENLRVYLGRAAPVPG